MDTPLLEIEQTLQSSLYPHVLNCFTVTGSLSLDSPRLYQEPPQAGKGRARFGLNSEGPCSLTSTLPSALPLSRSFCIPLGGR